MFPNIVLEPTDYALIEAFRLAICKLLVDERRPQLRSKRSSCGAKDLLKEAVVRYPLGDDRLSYTA